VTRHLKTLTAALVFSLALWVSGPAASSQGFYLGTGVGADFPLLSGDVVDDTEPGPGLSLELIHIGYNFTDRWGAGVLYGVGGGPAHEDPVLGKDNQWNQEYWSIYGRLSLDEAGPLAPYLELGGGQYRFYMEGDDGELRSDYGLGGRAALGALYYINNLYIAPEISYHFVRYDGGAGLHPDFTPRFRTEFHTGGDMLMLLIKAGYHWRR